MGGQRDALALVLDRLDTIADLLRVSLGLSPQYIRGEEIDRVIKQGGKIDTVLRIFAAAALPSAPAMVEEYTVGVDEILLAENESQPLMRVDITNDNGAQPLWVAGKSVLKTTGRLIRQKETVSFVLPEGATLYGITDIPFISVRVSTSFDLYSAVTALEGSDSL